MEVDVHEKNKKNADYGLQIYKELIALIKFDSERIHNNFKLFLTVNSILIAAIGYLWSSILKPDSKLFPLVEASKLNEGQAFVLVIIGVVSILGIIISFHCFLLMNRIGWDNRLRYYHLRRIERDYCLEPYIFTTGYFFFHKGKELDNADIDDIGEVPKPPGKFFRTMTRSIYAYRFINISLILLYVIILYPTLYPTLTTLPLINDYLPLGNRLIYGLPFLVAIPAALYILIFIVKVIWDYAKVIVKVIWDYAKEKNWFTNK